VRLLIRVRQPERAGPEMKRWHLGVVKDRTMDSNKYKTHRKNYPAPMDSCRYAGQARSGQTDSDRPERHVNASPEHNRDKLKGMLRLKQGCALLSALKYGIIGSMRCKLELSQTRKRSDYNARVLTLMNSSRNKRAF